MIVEKLDIEIPKDLNKFKEEIIFGLTLRQLLAVVLIILIAIANYLLSNYLNESFSKIVTILLVTPTAVIGFANYNNMTGFELIKMLLKYFFTPKIFIYADYDIDELIEVENDKKSKKDNKKATRKRKK